MDKYRQWLTEQVQYWNQKCMDSAASYGYPGKIKYAEQYMRENLDAYEQCLAVYDKLHDSESDEADMNNKPVHEADASDTTLTVYAETGAVVLEIEMPGAVIRLRLDAAHVRGLVLDLRSALAEMERGR